MEITSKSGSLTSWDFFKTWVFQLLIVLTGMVYDTWYDTSDFLKLDLNGKTVLKKS